MKGKSLSSTGILAEPYQWPHDGDLSPSTALVIIDMQNDCEWAVFFPLAIRHYEAQIYPAVCSPGGYLDHQGYPLEPMRAPIPHILRLLEAFRRLKWPVFHTREGHRADLSDLTTRELFRSRNNPSKLGILHSRVFCCTSNRLDRYWRPGSSRTAAYSR
jgi:hypothetical protein